ncbi:histidine kinase [Dermatophilaceae bacterium Soc4.6]
MISFAVASLALLIVVGAASNWVARDMASKSALRDAALRGGMFARISVTPLLAHGMTGTRVNPDSELVSVLESRMKDGSVRHIKLWDQSGRVLWADEKELVGRTFVLDADVVRLFATPAASSQVAEVTHLDQPENALEVAEGQLLEVYTPTTTPEGLPVVVETYWSVVRIDEAQWALLHELIPLVFAALLIFALAMLPLALSLARRVDRGLAERELMMQHALSASELERHRIASQLHDGVIQDLAGIGFALPSIAAGLHASANSTRELLGETHRLLLKDVAQLRDMLTELYPGNLGEGRLAEAVEALALRAEHEGVRTRVHVDTTDQTLDVSRMAYRIVREGVQNVLKHARAKSMEVTAGPTGAHYVVRVVDDGEGPSAAEPMDGHMGLQLLAATLTDLGGTLSLTYGTTCGTVLEARFPCSPAEHSRSGPLTGTRRVRSLLFRGPKKSPRSVVEHEVSPTAPRGGPPPA